MKIKMGEVPLVYPVPIVLAGAKVNGKPNYVTLGDCGIMGIHPPLVYISLHREHFTTQGVVENKTFSVNLPTTDMLAVTDYCGIISGREEDKGALFETFYGELETAPMIAECPVNLECQVVHTFSIEHRQIFVGRVVQAHVEEKFVIQGEGKPKIAPLPELQPILYALDNCYYSVGKKIGVGYQEGRKLRKK
jgi:flavin reductase (DIM6/NTAB) family NADH-FMN oxidoreductase RutF